MTSHKCKEETDFCRHSGRCLNDDRSPSGYHCLCQANFTGARCENPIDLGDYLLFDGEYSFLAYEKPTPSNWKFSVRVTVVF